MFEVVARINGLTGNEKATEKNFYFMDRATAREMAGKYLECEDVYSVDMLNAFTGELLYYEAKF